MELLLGFWLGWGGTGLWGEIVSCHAIPIFHALSIFPLFLVVSAIFLELFLFKPFSAVCWIGDGSPQAGRPSCLAKS